MPKDELAFANYNLYLLSLR